MFTPNQKVIFQGSEVIFIKMSLRGDGESYCWIWYNGKRCQVNVMELSPIKSHLTPQHQML